MPKIIETKINETTMHAALPTEMNNIILNSAKLNQQIFQNKRLFLSKLKKKPELLIIFNHTKKQALIKESTLEKIPLIEFNFNFSRTCWHYNYNVPGNINSTKNKIIDNIFILILNSLLNRSSKTIIKTKHGINNNKKKKPTIL